MFKPLNHRINQWHGRRVWVVGASSGIGAALAQALLQAGARVVLSARSASGLAQVAAPQVQVMAQSLWRARRAVPVEAG